MKSNFLTPTKNIFISHFKSNWKIILPFIFGIFLVSFLAILIPFSWSEFKYIGTVEAHWVLDTGRGPDARVFGLGPIIAVFVFGSFGTLIFSIFSLLLTGFVITSELKKNKMSIWMATPSTRNQIIMSKLLFVIAIITVAFLVVFIPTIIFSSVARDANLYLDKVILQGIFFYLMNVLVAIAFFFLAVIFSNQERLSTSLSWAIIGYIAITEILMFFHKTFDFQQLNFVEFIALQSLMPKFLAFGSAYGKEEVPVPGIPNLKASYGVYTPANKILLIASPIIQGGLTTAGIVGISSVFNRKDIKA
ncbi:hypothetical protein NPX79_00630 [Spiroplasma endosymbiont of Anurida maritima]|uniref:ABC transporter permease subunit n=1 Tax=Spiroplasma endosymbiont of Anurida maritima TaxID=2967972 RepID=UPI0036D39CEF